MAVLEKKEYDKVIVFGKQAVIALNKNNIAEFLALAEKGWNCFPIPKSNWNQGYNYAKMVFNGAFMHQQFADAKIWLDRMVENNEALHLSDEEVQHFEAKYYFETSDFKKALEKWRFSVKGAGLRYFEDEDPKYLEFYKNPDIILAKRKETVAPKIITQELTDQASEQIEELSEQGNEYFDDENYTEAIKIWKQALALIPKPQNGYAESQWLETSIGDAYFLSEEFAQALEHFQNAKNNIEANAYENPFIMLRLGQSFLENNQPNEAKEYLLRAYMFEGEEIFEKDDTKYFEFLKQNVELE